MSYSPYRSPDYFIFGCERGGTTLLGSLLTGHPELHTVNDSFIYQIFAKSYLEEAATGRGKMKLKLTKWVRNSLANRSKFLYTAAMNMRARLRHQHPTAYIPPVENLPPPNLHIAPRQAQRFVKALMGRYRQPLPGQKAPTWLAEYAEGFESKTIIAEAEAGTLTLRGLLDLTFAQLIPSAHRSKTMLGEKTPAHLYYSLWIRSQYPQARFIVLMRSPLTNIAAIYKRLDGNLPAAIDLYKSVYHPQFYFLYDGSNSLPVKYETLLHEPEQTLAHIFDYLGVKAMADADSATSIPGDYIKKDYIGGGIDPSRDQKLRALLTAEQQQMIRKECDEILKRFYPEELH